MSDRGSCIHSLNNVIALFVLLILVSEYFLFVSQLYAYLVAQKENCAFNFVQLVTFDQYGTTLYRPSHLILPPDYLPSSSPLHMCATNSLGTRQLHILQLVYQTVVFL